MSRMVQPAISVIMPVFNADPYLEAALRSIRGQTFGDWELIAIDDGSTDRSFEILERFAREDRRMHVGRRHHGGYASILNSALAVAKGSLIARMDADDIAAPRRFEMQRAFLEARPGCVAVGGQALFVDAANWPVHRHPLPTRHEDIDRRHLEFFAVPRIAMIHSTVTMRASALRAVGGYREHLEPAEDLDLWLRLAEIGEVANLDASLVRYRVHERSVSVTRSREHINHLCRIAEDAHRRRGLAFPFEHYSTDADAETLARFHVDRWIKWAWEDAFYHTAAKHWLRRAGRRFAARLKERREAVGQDVERPA